MSTDEGGDGDGQFYLPGGHLMPDDVLEECQEFSENVNFIFIFLTESNNIYLSGALSLRQVLP